MVVEMHLKILRRHLVLLQRNPSIKHAQFVLKILMSISMMTKMNGFTRDVLLKTMLRITNNVSNKAIPVFEVH